MTMNLSELSEKELLQLDASIIEELRNRQVVRTSNNPLGDYTEWVVAKALNLKLAANSSAGFDAIDENDNKIQIKGRRITKQNKSRQLGAIRNLDMHDFDQLAAVVFDHNYNIIDALLIPHAVVCEYAVYRKHVNAHILHLQGEILDDSRSLDIKPLLETLS